MRCSSPATCKGRGIPSPKPELTMSIDARCKEQQRTADRLFMDFKYTAPGSEEQIGALLTLSFLVGMWADFLSAEEKRMTKALALEAKR